MSGKPKEGLDYAGWSVNIFDGDTKIDKLLEAQGWIGFGIYFYLCQMAYKFGGYFYRWSYDDSVTTARRMGGGVKSETVNQTVGLCLQIGLFDKRLFDRDGILTSRDIQETFYTALRKRRSKAVIADYWLLGESESKGLEMRTANVDVSPAKDHSLSSKEHLQTADATIVEDSIGKDRKVEDDAASGRDSVIAIVFKAYSEKIAGKMPNKIKNELTAFIQEMGPECCIRAMDVAIEANAANWNYVRGILNRKMKQGVRCISDWDKKEDEYHGTRKSASRDARKGQTESESGRFDNLPGIKRF